jgi:hypothetical protein
MPQFSTSSVLVIETGISRKWNKMSNLSVREMKLRLDFYESESQENSVSHKKL